MHLDDAVVSDAGLESLKVLSGLERLSVADTGVSQPGINRLAKVLDKLRTDDPRQSIWWGFRRPLKHPSGLIWRGN